MQTIHVQQVSTWLYAADKSTHSHDLDSQGRVKNQDEPNYVVMQYSKEQISILKTKNA